MPCCAAFCRSPTGGLQVPRSSRCSKSHTQIKGSCGSFELRDTEATNDNPESATQHKTSCRTSFDANALLSVPVGDAGDDANENEHADMDSKELRAFVGEPILLISDDCDCGDVAERSSEATEVVGELRA